MSHYSERHYIPDNEFDRFYYSMLFRKGDKILDIACSTGNFIAQDPKNIIGIDSDKDSVRLAKKRGFTVLQHDVAKKLPFKVSSIDNVNCRYLLEHLGNPLFLIKEAYRILKNNGRLVLVTDMYTPRFWDDYTHKRPFTKKSLGQLAFDAGFRKYSVHYYPPSGVFGLGFLHKHKLISSKAAKEIYRFFGKLKKASLLLEATK